MIDTPLITLQDAAKQLGKSPKFLRRLIDRTRKGQPGGIAFFQNGKGGAILFRQEWLAEFVAEHTHAQQKGPVARPVSRHGLF